MATMHTTPGGPEAVEIDTRSLYLCDDLPALYVSLPGGGELRELLVPFCMAYGLQPFDGRIMLAAGEGTILPPLHEGWQVVFEYDLGDHQAPLMTIEWPAMPAPMVYGVRKDSPASWATDAIVHGEIGLIVGPPVDWASIVVTLGEGDGLVSARTLLHAVGGGLAAAGLVPATVRS